MDRRSRAIWPLLATGFALWCGLGQVAAEGRNDLGFERVLAHFNNPAPPPYRAYRRLEAGDPSTDKHAWLEAWTTFQPGRGLTFEVARESGSSYVRHKVLRAILEKEQALIAAGSPLHAALDSRNYSFQDGGATTDGLQRVILRAARKSDGIVNGNLFMAPGADFVSRLEGRLVKSPSFWLRDVDIVWKFARVGGHVVPVELVSSGRVRFFGRSSFKMTYEYAAVEGRNVTTLASARQ